MSQGRPGGPWNAPQGQSPFGQQQGGQGFGSGGFGSGFGQNQGGWGAPPQQWGTPQQGFGGQGFGQQGFGGQGFGQGYPQQGYPQGQQQWGQQGQPGGPGPWQAPQPPQRRRGKALRNVLLLAGGVLALIIIGLVINSMRQPDYQNDDYQPPAAGPVAPRPEVKVAEVPAIYTDNVIYQQRVATPTRCELNPGTVDIETASDAQMKSYIGDLMACNLRVWDPAFQGTKRFQQVRPVVNIYHATVTTPCGGGKQIGPNALYCSANQQVYYSRDIFKLAPSLKAMTAAHAVDEVMSHEYGHAIQARTGIDIGQAYTQQKVSERDALELNRRMEMQADCFSGITLSSIAQSAGYTNQTWQGIRNGVKAGGDDVINNKPNIVGNHGHATNREYWFQVGATANGDVGRCNTFKAPSSQVE